MQKRCVCERKKLTNDGICSNCGGKADLDREQFVELVVTILRGVETEDRRSLVRVHGRRRQRS